MTYDTDLTDKKWSIIEPIFTKTKKGKHLQKHSKLKLANTERHLTKQATNDACYLKNTQTTNRTLFLPTSQKKRPMGKNKRPTSNHDTSRDKTKHKPQLQLN